MTPEGSDLNEGPDERFEAVSWSTSSVGSFGFCGEEENCGKGNSGDVLEGINTERVQNVADQKVNSVLISHPIYGNFKMS